MVKRPSPRKINKATIPKSARFCEVCEDVIAPERMKAVPLAKRCIYCEEMREKRWGVRVRSMEVVTTSYDADSFEGSELFFTRDKLRRPRPK